MATRLRDKLKAPGARVGMAAKGMTSKVATASKNVSKGSSHIGKEAFKFQFDLHVDTVYGLKEGTYAVKWTRGTTVQATENKVVAKRDDGSGSAFGEKLTITGTMFRDKKSGEYDVKDSKVSILYFKGGVEKTIAKVHFDLKEYVGVPTLSKKALLQLSPDRYKVSVLITSTYLKAKSGGPGASSISSSLASGISAASTAVEDMDDLSDLDGDIGNMDDLDDLDFVAPHEQVMNLSTKDPPITASRPESTGPTASVVSTAPVTTAVAIPSESTSVSVSSSGQNLTASAVTSVSPKSPTAKSPDSGAEERRGPLSMMRSGALGFGRSDNASKEWMRKFNEAEGEISTLKSKLQTSESEATQLRTQLTKIQGELNAAQQSSPPQDSDKIARLESRIDELESEQRTRQSLLAHADADKARMQTKIDGLESHVATTKATYDELSGMYNKLRADYIELKKAKAAVEDNGAVTGEKMRSLERDHAAAEQRASSLQQENDRLKSELRNVQLRIKNFEETESDLTEEIKGLKQKLADTQGEVRRLSLNTAVPADEDRIRRKDDEIADLQDQLENLRKEQRELKRKKAEDLSELESRSGKAVAEADALVRSLRSENREFEEEAERQKREVERLRAKLNTMQEEDEERLSTARQQDIQVADLERRNKSTEEERERLEKELRSLKTKQLDLESEATDLREENERYQKRLDAALGSMRGEGEPLVKQKSKDGSRDDRVVDNLVESKMRVAELEENNLKMKHLIHKLYRADPKLAAKMEKSVPEVQNFRPRKLSFS
mmetsp:Transcript_8494/g.25528  ORF Transcript_8494/g.25528 Transcript_8494/m.25528 type:complete len:783 (+) Transcript_8494:80-2428(+)|eukprot:CAMPEP_0198734418 /NCGR_PEP_ID=MMETSP1475-20131203/52378_1 /TAXON_ID= ORGANISM="Unidentified sp., Strain CCMP1999" /NCGR_SAMPLE_ID=MMETSP1475 /ASSEMBLY_ACC=CAM_ASM_001111 /LENGTH=782 /DNA_ID=CAMNT_0044497881 /DNA_START=58 /DNA_END=2406 /DNA_ORIENTATION=-